MGDLMPIIMAEFEVDDEGKPICIESDGLQHFRIKLKVADAPSDAYAVTYHLDPTYHEPVREARDVASGFVEELTSYGDYTVNAKIRSKTGVSAVATRLSRALEKTYKSTDSPGITEALTYIRDH